MILRLKGGLGMACDCCGKTFSHGGRTTFMTAYAAVEAAKCQGWISLKNKPKDLCCECRRKGSR